MLGRLCLHRLGLSSGIVALTPPHNHVDRSYVPLAWSPQINLYSAQVAHLLSERQGWLGVFDNSRAQVSEQAVSQSCARSRLCVCMSFIFISLHAARRAMAAACRCPRGQQPVRHPHYKTRTCPQPLWVILGHPSLLLPKTVRQKERILKRQRKGDKRKGTT